MAVTCGAELNNAMASAINVLGDVHGGAGQQCMELYREIDARSRRRAATSTRRSTPCSTRFIAEHGKIVPGFGHRFHPVDPRTAPLLALVDEAAAAGAVSRALRARSAARSKRRSARRKGKPIPMNIDGVTAVIFCELGFEPPLGRGLFILSRSVGILAHAWEQMQQGGRIKGPMPQGDSATRTPGRRARRRRHANERDAQTSRSTHEGHWSRNQLVQYLEERGVEHIFGLCGHTNIAVLAALEKSDDQVRQHAPRADRRARGRRLRARQAQDRRSCSRTSGPG